MRRGIKFVGYVVGDGKLRGEVAGRAVQLSVKDEFVMLGLRENPYPYVANCRYYAVLQGDAVLDDTGCNGTKGEI